MAADANKALIRRFFDDVMNRSDEQAAEDIVAPDYVAHHPAVPEGIRGPGGLMQFLAGLHAAFPDLRYEILDLVAEGDMVAARWRATGTHKGTFFDMPATGRSVSVAGIDMFRVRAGRCAESWVHSDFLGLFRQLGSAPH